MNTTTTHAGEILKTWRRRRGLSQLDLAADAGISQRHLSFMETCRSTPSRDMALHLAEQLEVPLRDRNALLAAAGFAPVYRERPLDDPALAAAREAVELILQGHEPYPAIAVDRRWTLIHSNRTAAALMGGADPKLTQPPVNVVRVSLHPDGLASRIANFSEWRHHVLQRLAREAAQSGDPEIAALAEEVRAYPTPPRARIQRPPATPRYGGIAIPLELKTPDGGVLSFLSATTMFGSPVEISLEELMIESFFPANAETAAAMQAMAGLHSPPSPRP
ncbi:MAG: helix-turn-helix domain-containing protein [Minwuia sp.]|uniref:helix-turn-helix domain-containing protein n=1 Tax=Minwuia sp. TaxID=2493630 RepID=UPI003A8873E4